VVKKETDRLMPLHRPYPLGAPPLVGSTHH